MKPATKWDYVKSAYKRGKSYTGQVLVSLPEGYWIQLNGRWGTTGFLRRVEVPKAVREHYLPSDDVFEKGEPIEVAVEGYDDKNYQLILTLGPLYEEQSLRRYAERKIGESVTGSVVSHVAGGAFVDIDGGGSGYLGIGQIALAPYMADMAIEDLLHVGDRIRAKIVGKNDLKKRLDLSISAQSGASQVAVMFPQTTSKTLPPPEREPASAPKDMREHPRRQVLVIENDELSAMLITRHLESAGHTVSNASTLAEAGERVRSTPFEFIIADVCLDKSERSVHGVITLCKNDAAPKAVFVTGEYLKEDKDLILGHRSKVREAILKPIEWDRLLDILDGFEPPEMYEFEAYEMAVEPDESSIRRYSPAKDELDAIKETFDRVEEQFPRCGVCALKGKKGSNEFDCMVQKRLEVFGLHSLLVDAKYDWKYSPIGDVVFHAVSCRETRLSESDYSRFRRVLDARDCRFDAVIGEPVLVYDLPVLGLFVFYPKGASPSQEECKFLRDECSRLSVEIEAARNLNQLALSHSRLSASAFLLHELGGQVGNLDAIEDVEEHMMNGDFADAYTSLENLKKACSTLKETIHFFRDVSQHTDSHETRSLYAILYHIMNFLRPRSDKYDIQMSLEVSDDLEDQFYPETSIRQIMINLIMNAILQIHESGSPRREVKVDAEMDGKSVDLPVAIRVIDSATGVHWEDRHRIFAPYVTTRKGGTGLGLHICERLVKSLGGEISVEESWMYYGSTFLVRLPARKRKEQ